MEKLFYFDLETTGVEHKIHGIHQISGMIEIGGIIKETFNFKVRPDLMARIEDEALKVANVTREQILSYEPHESVYAKLIAMMAKYVDKYNKQDKFFLVGFNNASFDNHFLRQWFLLNKDNYFGSWFWSNCEDAMVLATRELRTARHLMPDFKLKSVAMALGIEVDETKLHDAHYDIALTRGVYKACTTQADIVDELWEVLAMINDADNDHKKDGGEGIPPMPKARIDALLKFYKK